MEGKIKTIHALGYGAGTAALAIMQEGRTDNILCIMLLEGCVAVMEPVIAYHFSYNQIMTFHVRAQSGCQAARQSKPYLVLCCTLAAPTHLQAMSLGQFVRKLGQLTLSQSNLIGHIVWSLEYMATICLIEPNVRASLSPLLLIDLVMLHICLMNHYD